MGWLNEHVTYIMLLFSSIKHRVLHKWCDDLHYYLFQYNCIVLTYILFVLRKKLPEEALFKWGMQE